MGEDFFGKGGNGFENMGGFWRNSAGKEFFMKAELHTADRESTTRW